jgi:Family of unknown function (DUF6368)
VPGDHDGLGVDSDSTLVRRPRAGAEAGGGGVKARHSPVMPFCRSNRQLAGILKGMAGPAASVLSPKRLTASDLQILLASFPGELMKHNSKGDEWVFTTLPDGNTQRQLEDTSSFDVQLDDLGKAGEFGRGFRSEVDFLAVEEALGWTPVSEVTSAAFRNRDSDHQALAWLSAEIAERVEGVIDVVGRLPIPAPLLATELTDPRIVEVPYEIEGSAIGVVQIATPAFLRGWRLHERFRMVK